MPNNMMINNRAAAIEMLLHLVDIDNFCPQ